MEEQINLTGDNTTKAIESAISRTSDGERNGIFRDIDRTLGVVPGFLKMLPPTHLASEWKEFKEFELSNETALPAKVKELVGLAVASVLHCKYCTYFHTVGADMQGATAEEINEALLMAKHTAGWSTYLTGSRYDLDQLKQEVAVIRSNVQRQGFGQGPNVGGGRH